MIILCRCPCSSTSRSAARSATRCGRARPGSAGNPASAPRRRKEPNAAGAWGTCWCPARPATPSAGTPPSTSRRTTSRAARPAPGFADRQACEFFIFRSPRCFISFVYGPPRGIASLSGRACFRSPTPAFRRSYVTIELSRRQLMASAGGMVLASFALPAGLRKLMDGVTPASGRARLTSAPLSEIQHVVVLMQENRSFDHYFGTSTTRRTPTPTCCPSTPTRTAPARRTCPPTATAGARSTTRGTTGRWTGS
jgi:Phosphoesterase family